MSASSAEPPQKKFNRAFYLRIAAVLAVLAAILPVALPILRGSGNAGGSEIAFLRNSEVYTIQPNGSGLYQVTGKIALGFSWSPDHHEMLVRFAGAALPITTIDPIAQLQADTYATLGIVSIDGGALLGITAFGSIPYRSDGWWDATGNRLIYREGASTLILSQPDQPGGIASKLITNTGGIPAIASNAQAIAFVNPNGVLLAGQAQQTLQTIQTGAATTLPGGLPARVLWRPGHQELLYVTKTAQPNQYAFTLTHLTGPAIPLAAVTRPQRYAFSPNGSQLLIQTAAGYEILPLHKDAADQPIIISLPISQFSDPWWSPNSAAIIIRTTNALYYINSATGAARIVATLPVIPSQTTDAAPIPIPDDPWNADGSAFVFASAGGIWADGQALAVTSQPGTGLYVAHTAALNTPPALIDWGEHGAISWSTPDPNTEFDTIG